MEGGDYESLDYIPYDLMEKSYSKTWRDDDAGIPAAFTFPTQDIFMVHPKPNAANQGTNYFRINYVYRPATLSHKSMDLAPAIHPSYHRTAKFFLASRGHEFLGNPQMADRFIAIWLESVKGRSVGRKDLIEGKVKAGKIMRWG